MDDALFPVASPKLADVARVKTAADVAKLPLINDLARQGWHDWFRAAGVHGAQTAAGACLQRHHRLPSRRRRKASAPRSRALAWSRPGSRTGACNGCRALAADALELLPRAPRARRPRPAAQAFIDWLLAER
jgi:hypothetical protein